MLVIFIYTTPNLSFVFATLFWFRFDIEPRQRAFLKLIVTQKTYEILSLEKEEQELQCVSITGQDFPNRGQTRVVLENTMLTFHKLVVLKDSMADRILVTNRTITNLIQEINPSCERYRSLQFNNCFGLP